MQEQARRKQRVWIVALVGVLALLTVNPFGISDHLRAGISRVVIPVLSVGNAIGHDTGVLVRNLTRLHGIQGEYDALQQEVGVLRAQIAQTDELTTENVRLREALDILPRERDDLLGAQVIVQDAQAGGGWVIVDRGEVDGVRVGMSVIIGESVLVGHVSEVFENGARILLITHRDSTFSVAAPGSGRQLLARGNLGTNVAVEDIPRDERIDVGMTLLTSRDAGEFTRADLGVGVIRELRDADDFLVREVYLETFFDPSALQEVFIIRGSVL